MLQNAVTPTTYTSNLGRESAVKIDAYTTDKKV
jgi:hypothetical protein